VPARRAALRLLDAVLRRGVPLDRALPRAAGDLPQPDRALALALAAESLRWLVDLDALIDSATARPLPADAKARSVLRLALAQSLILGTPDHAAIATALALVEGGPRRLVHGVFGTLSRRGARLPASPSLPEPVATRWRAAWGEETLAAASAAAAGPPPLDLTLADVAETDLWAGRLNGVSLMPGHLRLPRGADVASLPGYGEGGWWVQDLAASIPARLLGQGEGRRVLDLCAAPGGKTMQLAAAGWHVTALDLAPPRLEVLASNLARTGLAANLIAADLLAWAPAEPVAAILLDAPCSATGIFRRHPDVLHRVRDRDIASLAAQQATMAARAADWLLPGGILVYATCSAEPQEGEAVIEGLLAERSDLALQPIDVPDLPAGLAASPEGWLRIAPGAMGAVGGADSFFIARLQRLG
jgi:16S rRNA (cytosine967-C5)-methyltransferase